MSRCQELVLHRYSNVMLIHVTVATSPALTNCMNNNGVDCLQAVQTDRQTESVVNTLMNGVVNGMACHCKWHDLYTVSAKQCSLSGAADAACRHGACGVAYIPAATASRDPFLGELFSLSERETQRFTRRAQHCTAHSAQCRQTTVNSS